MTSDGQNASSVGLGLLEMYHPKSEEAKAYVKNFNNLRGNRILIFTDKRMFFYDDHIIFRSKTIL